jgi:nucleoside-triphosphatase THEP1
MDWERSGMSGQAAEDLEQATEEHAPFAAAVYSRETQDRDALARFVAELQAEGVRVGGLLQEPLVDGAGCKSGIDAVEVDTGRRFPINRPTAEDLRSQTCSLNTSELAESSGALRRAIAERADLIVLEKFGEQEQQGAGLNDEILTAIAEGIPLLIAVPQPALELWRERTGAAEGIHGATLTFDLAAFRQWWADVAR